MFLSMFLLKPSAGVRTEGGNESGSSLPLVTTAGFILISTSDSAGSKFWSKEECFHWVTLQQVS